MNEAAYVGFAAESMAETKSRVEVDCVSQEDAGLYECVASNTKKVRKGGAQFGLFSSETDLTLAPAIYQTEMVAAEVRVDSFGDSPECSPAPAGSVGDRLWKSKRRIAPRINQWISTYMQVKGTEAHLVCRTDHDDADKTTYWVGPDDQAIEESEKYRWAL